MTEVPEEQLMGYFMAGLQEEIQNQVRLLNPQELMIAMRRPKGARRLGAEV